ncbi:hypothetical protein Ddye_017991 [Dipteronia dyeriana]|uniref:Cytochrome P450 n=1 Tax=Dipteronia dyeriana TaxID=168575 RepID=A0AAD9UAG0_9ROSI|nr:hypothetical protein Ddye_017991 [Dipteronia dyeriana]
MDYLLLLLGLSFVLACIHFLTKSIALSTTKFVPLNLPPGPRPFPVIGNILQLGNKPHQALANLSKTYGPIMSLKLGSITTIVITSPQVAKEALQKHDHALSSRTIPDGARSLDHHKHSIAWLPVSASWRNLRKVCATQMFTAQKLDETQVVRRIKVQELVDYVHESCRSGSAVDIGQAAFTTVMNSISNTFFSKDLAHYQSDLSQNFKKLVCGVMEGVGTPNIADYFPVLRSVDPQGIRRRLNTVAEKIFNIFDGIIYERIQAREKMRSKESNDLLDSLLNLVEENSSDQLSLTCIKHLLLDIFVSGTDTTSSTVEWSMAELLHKQEKLIKAHTELRQVLGKDWLVQEFNIAKLPYLQAITKETLRLHPPAPFLIPHKAETEVEISSYMVPKAAQILVNVWAMGRDSSVWQNPASFMPERFIESEIDVKGRDFELIPFGAGRRICPGLPLAHRMVHLTLASLLYTFDWKLVHDLKPEDIDMTEKFGLTLPKSVPLLAIPIKLKKLYHHPHQHYTTKNYIYHHQQHYTIVINNWIHCPKTQNTNRNRSSSPNTNSKHHHQIQTQNTNNNNLKVHQIQTPSSIITVIPSPITTEKEEEEEERERERDQIVIVVASGHGPVFVVAPVITAVFVAASGCRRLGAGRFDVDDEV